MPLLSFFFFLSIIEEQQGTARGLYCNLNPRVFFLLLISGLSLKVIPPATQAIHHGPAMGIQRETLGFKPATELLPYKRPARCLLLLPTSVLLLFHS